MNGKTWADGPMLSFDIESTGVDVEQDRIVTASLVFVEPHEKPTVYEWLADPGIEIPATATAIHGITTEHAREHGRPARHVVEEIADRLVDAVWEGIPIVTYNAPYDWTMLDRELRRHGWMDLFGRFELDRRVPLIIDPLVLDRAMDPYRRGKGSRKLTYVCQKVYNIPLSDEDAHGSSADALAAARVAWKIARQYPECGELDLAVLQTKQAEWYRQWALDFEEYLRRKASHETHRDYWDDIGHLSACPLHGDEDMIERCSCGHAPDGEVAESIAIDQSWPMRLWVEPEQSPLFDLAPVTRRGGLL